MPKHKQAVDVVRVAVGAVVENMSTVQQDTPDHANSDANKAIQAHPFDELCVLITLRSAKQVLAGCWELPGGKIEPDESPEQAVVRELREEVGIEVKPIVALPKVEHTYDHATVCLLPFICQRLQGTPKPIEVDDARWVRPSDLKSYTFPEASLPVIDALLAAIEQAQRSA